MNTCERLDYCLGISVLIWKNLCSQSEDYYVHFQTIAERKSMNHFIPHVSIK